MNNESKPIAGAGEGASTCPSCGYTKDDAQFNMDHHLCKNAGNAPWEVASSPVEGATRLHEFSICKNCGLKIWRLTDDHPSGWMHWDHLPSNPCPPKPKTYAEPVTPPSSSEGATLGTQTRPEWIDKTFDMAAPDEVIPWGVLYSKQGNSTDEDFAWAKRQIQEMSVAPKAFPEGGAATCECDHPEDMHWPESKDEYKLRRCSYLGCDCERYKALEPSCLSGVELPEPEVTDQDIDDAMNMLQDGIRTIELARFLAQERQLLQSLAHNRSLEEKLEMAEIDANMLYGLFRAYPQWQGSLYERTLQMEDAMTSAQRRAEKAEAELTSLRERVK